MNYSVLVVDDEPLTRKYLLKAIPDLCPSFNQIYEAAHGKAGLDVLSEKDCDLIITDICMPEMDGLQALKKIKAEWPDAKVVMCSAMGQQAMVIEAIQSGARDFIVKPFQPDRVIEAVKKVVG